MHAVGISSTYQAKVSFVKPPHRVSAFTLQHHLNKINPLNLTALFVKKEIPYIALVTRRSSLAFVDASSPIALFDADNIVAYKLPIDVQVTIVTQHNEIAWNYGLAPAW
jgi:hypothetical protein